MQDFISFFGHGFCHQISTRSFEAGGLLFSACSRDTGIHMGFAMSLIMAFVIYALVKQKPGEIAPWPHLVFCGLLLLPMAIDGVSSYLGLRETTNTIRYFTGVLTGYGAGCLIAPLLFAIRRNANLQQKIFSKPKLAILHFLAATLLATGFFFVYPYLNVVAPFIAIAAFLLFILSLNLIVITLIPPLFPKHTRLNWLILVSLCLILSLIEIAALGQLRELMEYYLLDGRDLSTVYQ